MQSSLVSRLNALAKVHIAAERCVFTNEFLDNWTEQCDRLIEEYKSLEEDGERKILLQKVFYEVLMLTTSEYKDSVYNFQELSNLVNSLIALNKAKNSKMLISMINCFPEKNDSIENLIRSLENIDDELCSYVTDDKLLQGAGKWSKEQRSLFKKNLLDEKYVIKKYNLVSENPTGFTQVITLLIIAFADPDRHQKLDYYWCQIQFTAGKYSLDPIRVLDLILEISATYVIENYRFIIELLKVSDFWPRALGDSSSFESLGEGGNMIASRLLVTKLQNTSTETTRRHLLNLTCILIKEGFVSFVSIFENLGPDDDTIEKFLIDYYEELELESTKGLVNPLAMASALPDEDEDEEDKKSTNIEDNEKDRKNEEEEKENLEKLKSEQRAAVLYSGKLELLERLLAHGCLAPSIYILRKYPKLVYPREKTVKLILRIYEYLISPYYTSDVFDGMDRRLADPLLPVKYNQGLPSRAPYLINEVPTDDPILVLGSDSNTFFYYKEWDSELAPADDLEQIFKYSHEWLSFVGPNLAKAPELMSKLCRIGVQNIEKNNYDEHVVLNWFDFVRKFIFPATPLLAANPAVAIDVYSMMKLFPFEKRYLLYNEMTTKLSQDDVFIKVAFNKAERDTKNALKSLSIDNLGTQSRKIAKIVSTNPLATLPSVIGQIENYDKVSELIVATSKFFNDFAYDVLQYTLLLKLTSGRNSIQADGVNQMMWVQRLAVFIADLVKNSPKMDITNIVVYVVKTLHKGDTVALSILKELVSRVGGIRDLNEISWSRLVMLNSGKCLQKAARELILDSRDDYSKRSIDLLHDFLKLNALSEVIILLQNLNLTASTEHLHYKILSSKSDGMNALLWSFIEMVKYFLTDDQLVTNILSFDKLINEFNVPTQWAFHIWRDYFNQMLHRNEESSNMVDEIIRKADFRGVDLSNMSNDLFINFWRLSLYDVQFNKSMYDDEKTKIEKQLVEAKSSRRRAELSTKIQHIMSDCISHQKAYNDNKTALGSNSSSWIKDFSHNEIGAFFQYCVIPRVFFSPPDAIFGCFFIFETFSMENVIKIFDFFFNSHILSTLIFTSTASEAGNLGIFYKGILQKFEELRRDKEFDEATCKMLYQWHSIIAEDVAGLLSESNYMSIRNAIEFMKHVSAVFPVVNKHIELVFKTIEDQLIKEDREDIKLPSNALIGHLKARMKHSLDVVDFCELEADKKEELCKLHEEQEEIEQYKKALENEKREAQMRERLEREAKERKERGTKENDTLIPTGPSAFNKAFSSMPMSAILDDMDETFYWLKQNDIAKVLRCIKNETHRVAIKRSEENSTDKVAYRKAVAVELEKYFKSLVANHSHHIFSLKLRDILMACNNITNPAHSSGSKSNRLQGPSVSMYDDEPTVSEKAPTSRFNGNTSSSRYNASSATAKQPLANGAKQSKPPSHTTSQGKASSGTSAFTKKTSSMATVVDKTRQNSPAKAENGQSFMSRLSNAEDHKNSSNGSQPRSRDSSRDSRPLQSERGRFGERRESRFETGSAIPRGPEKRFGTPANNPNVINRNESKKAGNSANLESRKRGRDDNRFESSTAKRFKKPETDEQKRYDSYHADRNRRPEGPSPETKRPSVPNERDRNFEGSQFSRNRKAEGSTSSHRNDTYYGSLPSGPKSQTNYSRYKK